MTGPDQERIAEIREAVERERVEIALGYNGRAALSQADVSDLLAALDAEREQKRKLEEALREYDGVVEQAVMEVGSTNRSRVEFEGLIADAVTVMRVLRRRHRAALADAAATDEGET